MDREALKELLRKVESGWNGNTEHDFMQLVHGVFGRYDWRVISAFRGDPNPAGGYHPPSLDAARSLHEAVLPGWSAGLGTHSPRAVVQSLSLLHAPSASYAESSDLARAWLICILKALISQEGE